MVALAAQRLGGLLFALWAMEALGSVTNSILRTTLLRQRLAEATRSSRPTATVYPETRGAADAPGAAPQEAELLRFVTAYRTGLEALVDATPYTPLLTAAAADATASAHNGNLTFYAFIDTWVNNGTGRDVLYMNNITKQCTPLRKSDGNGWTLSLDLILWPRMSTAVDTRPRESVTLSTGYYGGNYNFGDITLVEGRVTDQGTAILLDSETDFTGIAGNPPVYKCDEGTGELQMPSLMGYSAQQADFIRKRYGLNSEERKRFADNMLETLLYPRLALVNVTGALNATSQVLASYNVTEMKPEVGMPVYYEEIDVFTDTEMSTMWLNTTYPLNVSGEVVYVKNGTMVLQLRHPCLPRGKDLALPRLLMPRDIETVPVVKKMVETIMNWSLTDQDSGKPVGMLEDDKNHEDLTEPLLLNMQASESGQQNQTAKDQTKVLLAREPLLGRLDMSKGQRGSRFLLMQQAENGTRSCVVQRHRQGHLFSRDFELQRLMQGDRVVMQLTVTGHGWAMTEEQCGEYCHAVYLLNFNGRRAGNITQFRDDCPQNPINGSMQFGTWDEHRNGWCPGSVEPGLFVDVTPWVQEGKNRLEFDVAVWSNKTARYEQYTDYSGFANGDQAMLTIGLSLFVYDVKAVQAILTQESPHSAAEKALRQGSSNPTSLQPKRLTPDRENARLLFVKLDDEVESRALLALNKKHKRHHSSWLGHRRLLSLPLGERLPRRRRPELPAAAVSAVLQQWTTEIGPGRSGFVDFEAHAPWYNFNQTVQGFPGSGSGAIALPIFKGALIQGASRDVRVNVSTAGLSSVDWAQAAFYLRLTKPPGDLEYDHWDRVGSVGLVVDGHRTVSAASA